MWITEYREGLGLDTGQFAHALSLLGARMRPPTRVSETLVLILERQRGVTHPRIANLIARACGATPEQRDMIVHKKHRGKWKAAREAALQKPTGSPWRTAPAATSIRAKASARNHFKAVVMVDKFGAEVRRFESVSGAARETGLSETAVGMRCSGKVRNEFVNGVETTFRFTSEWDAKPEAARIAEMEWAARQQSPKAHTKGDGRGVVVIDARGRELARYGSMNTAAEGEGADIQKIRKRCQGKVKHEFEHGTTRTYRFADEWDRTGTSSGAARHLSTGLPAPSR